MGTPRLHVAVCGLGSIGRRHTRNLVAREDVDVTLWRTRGEGNEWGLPEMREWTPRGIDAVIVAVPTARHVEVLTQVVPSGVAVLCEKPLVVTREEAQGVLSLIPPTEAPRRIALNMRFHPCVELARAWCRSGRIGPLRSARFAVGQYLPDWRPGTDHRASYSANASMGGGVALDLIHEVDIAEFLAGPRQGGLASLVARVGDVTVDTEDVAEILYRTTGGAVVSLHLDYLQRGFHREYRLVGATGTIELDLRTATIVCHDDRGGVVETATFQGFDRNDMYVALLEDFLREVRGDNPQPVLPSFAEGLGALDTVLDAKAHSVAEWPAR